MANDKGSKLKLYLVNRGGVTGTVSKNQLTQLPIDSIPLVVEKTKLDKNRKVSKIHTSFISRG